MKSLKAISINELREKVVKTEWYKKLSQRLTEVQLLIKQKEELGQYVCRDLLEERLSIQKAININMYGNHIRRGHNNNEPFIYNPGGHGCISWIDGYFKGEYFSFLTFRLYSKGD